MIIICFFSFLFLFQEDLTPLMPQLGKNLTCNNKDFRHSVWLNLVSRRLFESNCLICLIRAYDRAAIKFRGVDADINFTIGDYEEDMQQVWSSRLPNQVHFLCKLINLANTVEDLQMKNLSKEEFVHILRRQSTGFSRGSSKYRGVTLQKCGRWEARMGQFVGKK